MTMRLIKYLSILNKSRKVRCIYQNNEEKWDSLEEDVVTVEDALNYLSNDFLNLYVYKVYSDFGLLTIECINK